MHSEKRESQGKERAPRGIWSAGARAARYYCVLVLRQYIRGQLMMWLATIIIRKLLLQPVSSHSVASKLHFLVDGCRFPARQHVVTFTCVRLTFFFLISPVMEYILVPF